MPVPWVQMIKYAPSILSMANDLRQRARRMEKDHKAWDDPQLREMEMELKQQAEVMHALARQMEGLTEALAALRRSLLLASTLGCAALLLGLAALSIILFR